MFVDSARPEHQVEKYRQVREKKQRHNPGDGSLAGSAVHDHIEDKEDTQSMKGHGDQQDPII